MASISHTADDGLSLVVGARTVSAPLRTGFRDFTPSSGFRAAMRFLLHDRSEPPLILVTHYRSGLQTLRPTMPSADSCPPISTPYDMLSSECRTTNWPPGVSSAAFTTHLPNLPPRLLMVMAFAINGLLRQPGRPHIGFLFVRSWFCFTLPSDPASRRRPCALLVLRHHQAGQGTFTPELLSMPGTP